MTNKLSASVLHSIKDKSIKYFLTYAPRCRLEGMTRDLDAGEIQTLAFYDATLEVLNSMGMLREDALEQVIPKLFTKVHEIVEDETGGGIK